MDTIKNRLKVIADNYNLSIRALEEKCGLNRGNISNMSDNGNLGSDKLSKIFDTLPDVDPLWLITGRGNMHKTKKTQDDTLSSKTLEYPSKDTKNKSIRQDGIKLIDSKHRSQSTSRYSGDLKPRIPFDAAAGALSVVTDSAAVGDCEMLPTIHAFPRYDFTMPIRGDSMLPDFMPGDEVACQLVRSSSYIQWGRVHVLDTRDGAVLKRIYNDDDCIICKSINPTYSDFNVPKEDVLQIALVVGLIRKF